MNRGPATSYAKSRQPASERSAEARRADAGTDAKEICPHFHAAIELIGKRWSGGILRALTVGPLRFAEVAKCVPGLSDRLLSERLRELEGAGLVEREVPDGSPVRVVYGLTPKGEELAPVLEELSEWARRWKRAG